MTLGRSYNKVTCVDFSRSLLLFNEEILVAKRRNLKKEKAERNQAYARQFRQKSSRFSSRGGKRYPGNGGGADKQEGEE
jgi:hypothetical protein